MRANGVEPIEEGARGMPVRVARAAADDGEAWPEGLEEGHARSRGAAVVRDLQHVPAPSVAGQRLEEVAIAILLEIPGQERPLPAEADGQHDGGVIDAAAGRGQDVRDGR